MIIRIISFAFLLLLIPRAQSLEIGTYNQCVTNAQNIDEKISDCTATEIARRDRLLNETYQKLIKILESERQHSLKMAEISWLAYRDAECEFRASAEMGGTIANRIRQACRLEMLNNRIKQLDSALKTERF